MIWRLLGDILTAIVIVGITAFVVAVGMGIRAIHNRIMKN